MHQLFTKILIFTCHSTTDTVKSLLSLHCFGELLDNGKCLHTI